MESHGVEARMYADDLKVFAPTTTALNTQCIQTALDSLHEWSRVWQLPLAENKCTVLHLGRNNPKQQYTLGSITLEGSDEIRDLGFIIDKNLKFSAHIKMIAQKAMLASNMILRALKTKKVEVLIKAYTVYIRSILESGMIVSSPVLKLDKARLEKVQNYFTRRVFARCFGLRYPDLPQPRERNSRLGITSLEARRGDRDVKVMFALIHGKTSLSQGCPHHYRISRSRLRGPGFTIEVPMARTVARKNSFFVRTARVFTKRFRLLDSVPAHVPSLT